MKIKTFTQIENHEKSIAALADGYKSDIDHEYWLVDGMQKDAIQNSWDARLDKQLAKNWECGFVFKNINGNKFFYIVDEGTTGLSGTKFVNQSELVKILNSNKRNEDLAYFLNSNWSAKSSEEGGNRGRGKTLFLVASREKRIFFDSLRASDNSYVVGEVFLDIDKQVKFNLSYDEDARIRFRELTDNKIDEKVSFGTRIFIVNPETTIEKAMENGEIISFISHSRWETIKKYDAKIFIEYNNEKKYVSYPFWYDDHVKNVVSKEFRGLIKSKMKYRAEKLVLRYTSDMDLPETIKGIAIQRGGMTIERLLASDLIHDLGASNIYGWIEMENDPLEKEMLLCENPNHFGFSWSMRPAKYLKEFIVSKTREFAKEFKIIDIEQSKNRIQKLAEEDALKRLAPLFKKLNFFGKHKGKNTRKNTNRKENELLRLSISDLKFPGNNRRVNYGEKIKNLYVVPINDFCDSIMVLVRVYIILEDGKTEIIEEREINLRRGKGPKIGLESFLVVDKYAAGAYSIKAKMISLEDMNENLPDQRNIEKGTVLYDRINQKFFVEMDPPETGPFKIEPKGRDDKKYLFEWESEDEGYLIFYNEFHPRIKKLCSDKEKLTLYLSEQLALIAFQIKLEELIAENDEEADDFSKLIKSKEPSQALPFLLGKYSEYIWDLENKK